MHIFQQVLSCSGTFNGSLAGEFFIYFKFVSVYVFECVFWTERDQQQSITENGNFDVKQQANGHHHSNVYRPTSHDP